MQNSTRQFEAAFDFRGGVVDGVMEVIGRSATKPPATIGIATPFALHLYELYATNTLSTHNRHIYRWVPNPIPSTGNDIWKLRWEHPTPGTTLAKSIINFSTEDER